MVNFLFVVLWLVSQMVACVPVTCVFCAGLCCIARLFVPMLAGVSAAVPSSLVLSSPSLPRPLHSYRVFVSLTYIWLDLGLCVWMMFLSGWSRDAKFIVEWILQLHLQIICAHFVDQGNFSCLLLCSIGYVSLFNICSCYSHVRRPQFVPTASCACTDLTPRSTFGLFLGCGLVLWAATSC